MRKLTIIMFLNIVLCIICSLTDSCFALNCNDIDLNAVKYEIKRDDKIIIISFNDYYFAKAEYIDGPEITIETFKKKENSIGDDYIKEVATECYIKTFEFVEDAVLNEKKQIKITTKSDWKLSPKERAKKQKKNEVYFSYAYDESELVSYKKNKYISINFQKKYFKSITSKIKDNEITFSFKFWQITYDDLKKIRQQTEQIVKTFEFVKDAKWIVQENDDILIIKINNGWTLTHKNGASFSNELYYNYKKVDKKTESDSDKKFGGNVGSDKKAALSDRSCFFVFDDENDINQEEIAKILNPKIFNIRQIRGQQGEFEVALKETVKGKNKKQLFNSPYHKFIIIPETDNQLNIKTKKLDFYIDGEKLDSYVMVYFIDKKDITKAIVGPPVFNPSGNSFKDVINVYSQVEEPYIVEVNRKLYTFKAESLEDKEDIVQAHLSPYRIQIVFENTMKRDEFLTTECKSNFYAKSIKNLTVSLNISPRIFGNKNSLKCGSNIYEFIERKPGKKREWAYYDVKTINEYNVILQETEDVLQEIFKDSFLSTISSDDKISDFQFKYYASSKPEIELKGHIKNEFKELYEIKKSTNNRIFVKTKEIVITGIPSSLESLPYGSNQINLDGSLTRFSYQALKNEKESIILSEWSNYLVQKYSFFHDNRTNKFKLNIFPGNVTFSLHPDYRKRSDNYLDEFKNFWEELPTGIIDSRNLLPSGYEYQRSGPLSSPLENIYSTDNYEISDNTCVGNNLKCFTVTPKFKIYNAIVKFYEKPFTIENKIEKKQTYLPNDVFLYNGNRSVALNKQRYTKDYILSIKTDTTETKDSLVEKLKNYTVIDEREIYSIKHIENENEVGYGDSIVVKYDLMNKKDRVLLIYYPLQYRTSYRSLIPEKKFKNMKMFMDADLGSFVSEIQRKGVYSNIYLRFAESSRYFIDYMKSKTESYKKSDNKADIKDVLSPLQDKTSYDSPDYLWRDEIITGDYENYMQGSTTLIDVVYLDRMSTVSDIINKFRGLEGINLYLVNFVRGKRIEELISKRISNIKNILNNFKIVIIRIDKLEDLYKDGKSIFDKTKISRF